MNLKISESDRIKYFGLAYAFNPNEFEFTLGERKMIPAMVDLVKSLVDHGVNNGLKHFQLQKNASHKKRKNEN